MTTFSFLVPRNVAASKKIEPYRQRTKYALASLQFKKKKNANQ
jgi:hypothetical protein